jgi:hemolysin III
MQNRSRHGGVGKLTGKRNHSAERATPLEDGRRRSTAIAAHPDLFDYSWAEEVVHAVTHGLGAAFSMAGLVILVVAARNTGNPLALAAATVYGLTLVFCYVSSALYHGVRRPRLKRFFLLLDHAAIYLLIAGTYTPIALLLPVPRGWMPVALVWLLALIGIGWKVTNYRRGILVPSHRLSTMLYVGMGWSGLALGWDLLAHLPAPALTWLVAGGLVYSLGALVFLAHRIRFHHALWHLMVLAGSACHFWLVLSYVLPGSATLTASAL